MAASSLFWQGNRLFLLLVSLLAPRELLAFSASPRARGASRARTVCHSPGASRARIACQAPPPGDGGGGGGGDGESDVESFRKQLMRQMDASNSGNARPLGRAGSIDLWASPQERLEPGIVLIADYRMWREGSPLAGTAPFEQFALRGPLPLDLPPDLIARVLPVVLITAEAADGSHQALLLERRTGVLLGDLVRAEGDEFACAPINTLWFGGVKARNEVVALCQHEGVSAPEGLSPVFAGVSAGPWKAVRPLIEAGKLLGTQSMVFSGKTVFAKGELQRQIASGLWKGARLSRDLLFKERSEPSSRKGSKPLWREALELCDGEYAQLVTGLYGDEL